MNCIIGVSFEKKAYVLDVQEEPELQNTGVDIINWLRMDKTSFVSEIFKFQKFGLIKKVLDQELIPANKLITDVSFNVISITELQEDIDSVDYVYIYNTEHDLLFIKTPEIPEVIALDYNSEKDVLLYFEENGVDV
jgi:hypothetical protein